LSRIADAEIAGESVDNLFSRELEHMEQCERCAEAYSELFVVLETAVEAFGQTAETVESFSYSEPPVVDISAIWQRACALKAEQNGTRFKLKLALGALQIGEISPSYSVGESWRLPLLTLQVSAPIHLKTSFTRQTSHTCRLTIELQDAEDKPLMGYTIQIQYNQVTKTAETTPSGAAQFNNLPIMALPDLTITI
jgi:hypothetical protein